MLPKAYLSPLGQEVLVAESEDLSTERRGRQRRERRAPRRAVRAGGIVDSNLIKLLIEKYTMAERLKGCDRG